MPILPFKLNQDHRHHFPRQQRKVTNSLGALLRSWPAYDASLRQRGSLTVWFKPAVGDGLRSRTDERRANEVDIVVHALNRILNLGRPISVRVA